VVTAAPSDLKLFRDVWTNYTKAWVDGPAAAEDFLTANNYPPYQKDSEACTRFEQRVGVKKKAYTLDEKSARRDPSWRIPEGSQKGRKPSGRVYSMTITERLETSDGNAVRTNTTHVTIDDGRAYIFVDCAYIESSAR
jgi:hypothetical protein